MGQSGFLENYRYVFDRSGLFGANQKSPDADPLRFAGIVRRYHEGFTDDQVKRLIHKLRTEGCGYAAVVNTVFLRFYGFPEQFESAFGFPMYTSDGKLNFDDLLVDLYCATDNHYRCLWFDRVDPYEDDNYENGYGTTRENLEWRFESYMKKHGIIVDVEWMDLPLAKLKDILAQSPVIVSVRPCTLYDRNGKKAFGNDAGHTMTVTGFAANGLIRVASWGKEYYIRHESYSKYEYYQQVIYKKDNISNPAGGQAEPRGKEEV